MAHIRPLERVYSAVYLHFFILRSNVAITKLSKCDNHSLI